MKSILIFCGQSCLCAAVVRDLHTKFHLSELSLSVSYCVETSAASSTGLDFLVNDVISPSPFART